VRELVADLVAEGISATVRPETRETVEAVEALGDGEHVSIAQLAHALKMDKSAISRRVRVAIERGYLRNDEDRRGRRSKLAVADPLPEDVEILPSADEVREGCTVAGGSGGIETRDDVDLDRAQRLVARHADMFDGDRG
jgi:hypothetical protein